MAKNFIERGETIEFPANADLASGAVVNLNGLTGVNLNKVQTGDVAVAQVEGVWEFPAVAAATAGIGAEAYVTAGGQVTSTATDNTRIGRFWAELAAGQKTALVKINVA